MGSIAATMQLVIDAMACIDRSMLPSMMTSVAPDAIRNSVIVSAVTVIRLAGRRNPGSYAAIPNTRISSVKIGTRLRSSSFCFSVMGQTIFEMRSSWSGLSPTGASKRALTSPSLSTRILFERPMTSSSVSPSSTMATPWSAISRISS